MHDARAFLHFKDFKKSAHLTVYILAMHLLVMYMCIVQCTFIKICEYLTALFLINAKVRSFIIQPLQI